MFKSREDIKIGVIGYGGAFNMGKIHLSQAKEAGNMTPAAVCDLDPERTKQAKEDFKGIKTFNNVDEFIKSNSCNVVVVITPHNTHAELALKCLNAGKHVILEKPMAITTEECDLMIKTAKEKGLMLTTYHNRHWDGHILTAIQKIQKERIIGDVFKVNACMASYAKPGDWWRTSKSISGGILYDWGVHILEYTLQIMNSEISEVSGFNHTGFWADKTAWKADTNEDEGYIVVRYANGGWSTLTISQLDGGPKPALMTITGTEGTYLMDFDKFRVIKNLNGEKITIEGPNQVTDWAAYYKNVSDYLMKKENLIITPEWSRRTIHILDLACKSAEAGTTIKALYK